MTTASEIDRFEELLRSGSQGQIRAAIRNLIADADRMRKALEELEKESELCVAGHRQVMPKTVIKLARLGLGKSEYPRG